MPSIKQYIVEAVDGLGKTTLIQGIKNVKGYYPIMHYQKPELLEIYQEANSIISPLYEYQYATFVSMMQLIESKIPMIFDRSHIGEYIYAPMYRNYDGKYIFELEKQYNMANQYHTKLILLTTSNWEYIIDDGKCHDFTKRVEEQQRFIEAFDKSILPNKIKIDIAKPNGDRKTVEELLEEIGIF